jgi:hypothetical protein
MPRKNNSKNSTRKQNVKNRVKEANYAIDEELQKNSRILNELEAEKKHLQKEITYLNSQFASSGKTIFKFKTKTKMKTLKSQIEQRENELNIINCDIKNVTKDLKPYIIKSSKSALKSSSKSKSKSKSKSNFKSNSSSSKSTRRVKFKTNRIIEFDKSETVDSLLINRKGTHKNKTLKKSSK